MINKIIITLFCTWLVLIPCKSNGLSIIPAAKGFGTETRAAYGAPNKPVICIVTNLSDKNGNIQHEKRNGVNVVTGSLRECTNFNPPANTGKVIIFEVGGTITLYSTLKITKPYTTLAGQTAPNPGITLKRRGIRIKTHDVLIQHIAIRPGDEDILPGGKIDGIDIQRPQEGEVANIVIDHVSVSWSSDGAIDIGNDPEKRGLKNVTISNCILAEALYNPSGGYKSRCMAIVENAKNISLLNNLFANNRERNPSAKCGSTVYMSNNYIYNSWISSMFPHGGSSENFCAAVNATLHGNVWDPGPNTYKRNSLVLADGRTIPPDTKIYLDNNDCSKGTEDGCIYLKNDTHDPKVESPLMMLKNYNPLKSTEVWNKIKKYAGSRPKFRDTVDERIINSVINKSGKYIQSQKDVGNYPSYSPTSTIHNDIPQQLHADNDNDGYTNLEEWLQILAARVEGRDVKSEVSLMPPENIRVKK
jgi:pectate lyase